MVELDSGIWCGGLYDAVLWILSKGLAGDDHSGDVVVAMCYCTSTFIGFTTPGSNTGSNFGTVRCLPVSRLCQVSGYRNPGTDMDIVLLGSDGRAGATKGNYDWALRASHRPQLSRQVYKRIISLDLNTKLLPLDLVCLQKFKTPRDRPLPLTSTWLH